MPVATPKGSDGEVVSLGGGAAVALNDSLVLCTGGVNKDIFLAALRCPEKDYLLQILTESKILLFCQFSPIIRPLFL